MKKLMLITVLACFMAAPIISNAQADTTHKTKTTHKNNGGSKTKTKTKTSGKDSTGM